MSEIQYFYSDGRVRDGNYDELTVIEQNGRKKWNQAALRRIVEPLRPFKIVCRCREDGQEILMHVVEKPTGSGKYYLATNPKQSDMHEKNCPKRRMEETVIVVPPAETESAIQHVENADGTTTVHVEINPFKGGLRERQDTDVLDGDRNTLKQTERPSARVVDEDAEGDARIRKQKAQAEFGGLVREWYLYGRKTALVNREVGENNFLSPLNVVYGMTVSMNNDEILIGNNKNLKGIAFIPNKKLRYHANGERKILLGLYQAVEDGENGEKVLSIRGLNDTWEVSVPKQLAHPIDKPSKRRLIAVRVIRRDKAWRLTHEPFTVLLAEPDAMWVESEVEAQAYRLLMDRGFTVDKPLRIREDLGGLRPDFEIQGLDRPVIVEVYGRVNDPEYNEHKEVKREMYRTLEREGFIWYVEWDLEDRDGREKFLEQVEQLRK